VLKPAIVPAAGATSWSEPYSWLTETGRPPMAWPSRRSPHRRSLDLEPAVQLVGEGLARGRAGHDPGDRRDRADRDEVAPTTRRAADRSPVASAWATRIAHHDDREELHRGPGPRGEPGEAGPASFRRDHRRQDEDGRPQVVAPADGDRGYEDEDGPRRDRADRSWRVPVEEPAGRDRHEPLDRREDDRIGREVAAQWAGQRSADERRQGHREEGERRVLEGEPAVRRGAAEEPLPVAAICLEIGADHDELAPARGDGDDDDRDERRDEQGRHDRDRSSRWVSDVHRNPPAVRRGLSPSSAIRARAAAS
jgi:hypothetical protein